MTLGRFVCYVGKQTVSKQNLSGEGERGAGREATELGENPSCAGTLHQETRKLPCIWNDLLVLSVLRQEARPLYSSILVCPRDSIPLMIRAFLHSNPMCLKANLGKPLPLGIKTAQPYATAGEELTLT